MENTSPQAQSSSPGLWSFAGISHSPCGRMILKQLYLITKGFRMRYKITGYNAIRDAFNCVPLPCGAQTLIYADAIAPEMSRDTRYSFIGMIIEVEITIPYVFIGYCVKIVSPEEVE
jgi:hypothetical protein